LYSLIFPHSLQPPFTYLRLIPPPPPQIMLDLPVTSPSSPGTLRTYSKAPSTPAHITVLGAGAFGTAIAFNLARNGHFVKVLDVVENRITGINTPKEDGKRYNPDFLKEFPLPETFVGYFDPAQAFTAETEYIFSAIPIQFCFDYLTKIKPFIYREHIEGFKQEKPIPFVSLSKGIDLQRLELIHQVFERVFDLNCEQIAKDSQLTQQQTPAALNNAAIFGDNEASKPKVEAKMNKIVPCFLSGPSFAAEIAEGMYTGLTIASPDEEYARKVAELMNSDPKTVASVSTDYISCQLLGALKNVYAIGAGIIQGQYPDRYNTFSLYITLALNELRRIVADVWGGSPTSVNQFAGIGDFILSCTGPSRNRTLGLNLSTTKLKLSELLSQSTGVVEGVPTTKALHSILLEKEYLRQCPILRAIYAVLYANQPASEAFDYIFSLPVQQE